MMFATLDDLEGQVELLVFNPPAANADRVAWTDQIVRRRVDHKRRGRPSCRAGGGAFEPSEEAAAAARVVEASGG
jgi:hypothetical protein